MHTRQGSECPDGSAHPISGIWYWWWSCTHLTRLCSDGAADVVHMKKNKGLELLFFVQPVNYDVKNPKKQNPVTSSISLASSLLLGMDICAGIKILHHYEYEHWLNQVSFVRLLYYRHHIRWPYRRSWFCKQLFSRSRQQNDGQPLSAWLTLACVTHKLWTRSWSRSWPLKTPSNMSRALCFWPKSATAR